MQTYHRNPSTDILSYSEILAKRAERALFVYDIESEGETVWDDFLPIGDRERKRFLLERETGRFTRFLRRSGLRTPPRKL